MWLIVAIPQGKVMKTTLHTVVCIAIRLGAVFLAVGLVQQSVAIFLYPDPGGHLAVPASVLVGVGLLVAFALWLRPDILAWWAISGKQREILEISMTAEQVQWISFSVLGMWLFIGAMSNLVVHIVMILVAMRHSAYEGVSPGWPSDDWRLMLKYALTAVFGATLTLGARGLVGLLNRLRGYPSPHLLKIDSDTGIAKDG
jgi:hypothetical protein